MKQALIRRITAAMAISAAILVSIPASAQAGPLSTDARPTLRNPEPGTYAVQIDFHRDLQWLLRFWYIYVPSDKTPDGRPAYVDYVVQYYNVNPLANGTLTCAANDWPNPGHVTETITGAGTLTEGANQTYCSTHPDALITVRPGQYFALYARFRAVPAVGNHLTLHWGEWGSAYVDAPYGTAS
jgi:hypothetical protein